MARTSLDELRRLTGDAGLRLTPQRLQILRELAGDSSHPSAEELHERLRGRLPTLSLDTVYRTLATFERLGIVAKLQAAGDRARFDVAAPRHHHLVCISCGRIDDVAWSPFDALPLPATVSEWGQVADRRVQLRGLCRKCLADQGRGPGG